VGSALTAAAIVRARIAAGCLADAGTAARVGRFRLRPEQREALAAVERALERHGGALLADPPGTGKTVIALALASRTRPPALVAAPAALRAQWIRAAAAAGVEIRFASFESLGRGAEVAGAPLLIVDEAHHARTPGTRRYARLAEICTGARVLLLSATPVVNRDADRDALLALFLGARATALDARTLADVVVRRLGADDPRPPLRRLAPLRAAAEVRGLGHAISSLPPPLPAADGLAATALVRITLAMAWRSSLAALDATLRRREQRGRALADRLAAGNWPRRATLHLWVHGDDATQLPLPFDLDDAAAAPATALETVRRHLRAVHDLRLRIAPHITADARSRADALSSLVASHPTRRVVCFAQHAATIVTLWRALRQQPGVVAVTGERVRAAAGRWTRDELLRALGPGARALSMRDPRAIRLLLATDLLAEGVELQGVGIVVHGDAAWTPARLEQREGRAARAGAIAADVLVTHFRPPRGARTLLRLASRLAQKRAARTTALADASAEERCARLLSAWSTPSTPPPTPVSASVRGPQRRLLALVAHGSSPRGTLVAGRWLCGRWRLSDRPAVIARCVAAGLGPNCATDPATERGARAAIAGWAARERARAELGGAVGADAALWRQLRRRVSRAVDRLSFPERAQRASAWEAALRTIASEPGVGASRRIAALDRAVADDRAFADALCALAATWCATKPGFSTADHARVRAARPKLLALLLIEPERDRPVPPAQPEPSASCFRSASSLD
jgi:superfamily II DNA or RNA helicase